MKIVRQLDEELWRDFVFHSKTGNIFHTPEMFQVFARARGHFPSLWAAVGEGRNPLALLIPVQITLIGGLLRRFTTRAVAYGSAICAPSSEGKEALKLLLQAYKQGIKKKALFTELRNLSDLGEVQSVLRDSGFAYKEHLNFLIDLDRPPEAILQSIGRATRKKLRRALRAKEIIIEEVERHEQVRICYDLLKKTYHFAKVPIADISLFNAAFKTLHPRNMIKFSLARLKDTYVACSVDLLYKSTIYGWYGGTDRAFSRHIPGELLLWYLFEWGAKNGYKVYDFGGAGTPDEEYGVRDFKAKFGGKLVCFGRNTYVHSPLFRLSQRAYAAYRIFFYKQRSR